MADSCKVSEVSCQLPRSNILLEPNQDLGGLEYLPCAVNRTWVVCPQYTQLMLVMRGHCLGKVGASHWHSLGKVPFLDLRPANAFHPLYWVPKKNDRFCLHSPSRELVANKAQPIYGQSAITRRHIGHDTSTSQESTEVIEVEVGVILHSKQQSEFSQTARVLEESPPE